MIRLLNILCEIAALPKSFKVAVVWWFVVLILGCFALGMMDVIQESLQVDGFGKIKVTAWFIYLSTIAIMFLRIRAKWNRGDYHLEDLDGDRY